MASLYSDAQITELHEGRTTANRAFANLRERYLVRGYKDARAEEHAQHGFSRRLGTLIRAVDLLFDLLPPELDAIPERDTVVDATIAIQSFMLNTFGCLDNLAWIFVYEKGVTKPDGAALDPQSVSLGSKAVRASALTHSEDTDSLSSLARIEAADAFQTNGFGLALCSAR